MAALQSLSLLSERWGALSLVVMSVNPLWWGLYNWAH